MNNETCLPSCHKPLKIDNSNKLSVDSIASAETLTEPWGFHQHAARTTYQTNTYLNFFFPPAEVVCIFAPGFNLK